MYMKDDKGEYIIEKPDSKKVKGISKTVVKNQGVAGTCGRCGGVSPPLPAAAARALSTPARRGVLGMYVGDRFDF